MKVLKNFISHALFHRKLLEALFHPSKVVSEPRKKEEDLVPSAQSWIVGVVDVSPQDKRKRGHLHTGVGWGETSPDWSSVTQEIHGVPYAAVFSS